MTIITKRFSSDHQSRIEVHFQSETYRYMYDEMKKAGCKFFVKQPELRSRLRLEEIDFNSYDAKKAYMREAKAAELAALKAGDPVVWVGFGKHSGNWVEFLEKYVPRTDFDFWVTGFVVVKREIWNAWWNGKRPCTKATVMQYLQDWQPYITADLNGELCEWRYVNGHDGEDFWDGPFLCEDEALEAALNLHPECRYKSSDFDEIVEYSLKTA